MKLSANLQVTLACLFWSISALSRKFVLISLSPIFLNFLNALFVAILVFCISKHKNNLVVFRKNSKIFLINALSGVTIGMSLAYYSLELIDLSLYGLLIKLQPIFVIIIAGFFLNEKIKIKTLPYALVAIISCALLSLKEISNINNIEFYGVIAAVLTALSLSISSTSGKLLISNGVKPNQATSIRFALGALLTIPILPFLDLIDYANLDLKVVFWLLVGVLTNTCGFTLYYKGLKNIKITTASFIELLMPIFTAVLGILFLGESLTLLELIASSILLFTIYKINKIAKQH